MEPAPASPPEGERRATQPTSAEAHGVPRGGRPAAGGSQGRGGRAPEDGRRKRSSAERRYVGFGDGIERAYCVFHRHVAPPAFPVQHRSGLATLRPLIVGRRPGAILLCDGAHPEPHLWPDGDGVDDPVARTTESQPRSAAAGATPEQPIIE